MIKMEKLHDAIKYCLWTGHIKNEKPVSLLIIGQPESGKTSSIEKFTENDGIVLFNDVTPWGLVKELRKVNELKTTINHVLIPDFLNIFAKSRTSTNGMIQFLNSAMEEGLTKIQSYGIQFDIPKIQFGLITAITIGEFKAKQKRLARIGFLSRMIPFSYKYSIDAAQEVIKSIFVQSYHKEEKETFNFPKEKVDVKLSPELAEKMWPYTQKLAAAERLYGFRHQKQFQTLLKAIALSKGRNEVINKDVQELKGIAKYFNLDFLEFDVFKKEVDE